MREVWLDTFNEGKIHPFQPTHSKNWLAGVEALSLKIFSNRISLKWSQRLSQSAQE